MKFYIYSTIRGWYIEELDPKNGVGNFRVLCKDGIIRSRSENGWKSFPDYHFNKGDDASKFLNEWYKSQGIETVWKKIPDIEGRYFYTNDLNKWETCVFGQYIDNNFIVPGVAKVKVHEDLGWFYGPIEIEKPSTID